MGITSTSRFENRLPHVAAMPRKERIMSSSEWIATLVCVFVAYILIDKVLFGHFYKQEIKAEANSFGKLWSLIIVTVFVTLLFAGSPLGLGISSWLWSRAGVVYAKVDSALHVSSPRTPVIERGVSFKLAASEKTVDFRPPQAGFRWFYYLKGNNADVKEIKPLSSWPIPSGANPEDVIVFQQSLDPSGINSNGDTLK